VTRDKIITELFTSKNFNDCISKMEPPHLREDLKQEIILIVCEWPEDRITEMYDRNQLEFFVVRTILNQVKSNTSPFAKKYRRFFLSLSEYIINLQDRDDSGRISKLHTNIIKQASINAVDIEERIEREDFELKVVSEVDNLYWYNAELVKLYMKHGNYRAIQKETRIPFISCYKTIQKSFQELRSRVEPAARVVKETKTIRV